jgi:hypothetical protein
VTNTKRPVKNSQLEIDIGRDTEILKSDGIAPASEELLNQAVAPPLQPVVANSEEGVSQTPMSNTQVYGSSFTEDEDDRRSIQSGGSSGSKTLVSTSSEFTATEMESAAMELEDIFLKNAAYIKIYREAIESPSIGPRNLQVRLQTMFMKLSIDLQHEASTELEGLMSSFLLGKARFLAHCIVEKLHDKPTSMHLHDNEPNEEMDEEGEELDRRLATQVSIDEDLLFDDTADLRNFLTQSQAMKTFEEALKAVVLTQENTPQQSIPEVKAFTAGLHLLSSFRSVLRTASVALGILEPRLRPGMTRVRWQCVSEIDNFTVSTIFDSSSNLTTCRNVDIHPSMTSGSFGQVVSKS